ncbi:hypothetical protein GIB67_026732 [Kingdonia uniflora]|uniref:MULE transposase domain-containing protein n=1 Tax=Kingdonia uniflora TaxID=39325 RepID=A0A7J7MHB1_9MAGN|nr:hypothetical protein GIB67_026732 [Kingdonia uniflora]
MLSEEEGEDLDDLSEVYHSGKEIDPEEIDAYEIETPDGSYNTHSFDDEDYVPTAEDLERCNEFENVNTELDDIYSKEEDDKAKIPLTVGFKELEARGRQYLGRRNMVLRLVTGLLGMQGKSAWRASLNGFVKGCRPILGLDGYFLKGKYGGVCLSVLSLDANNGLFPIGVYMCRTECKESWLDFLAKIEPYLSAHPEKLTFISDRQKGLIDSVAHIFLHANHSFFSPYHFVASYVATYSSILHPVSDDTHWASPPYVVDPPPLQRGRGRPRKERKKGDNEVHKEQKNCGKCEGWEEVTVLQVGGHPILAEGEEEVKVLQVHQILAEGGEEVKMLHVHPMLADGGEELCKQITKG